LTPTKIFIEKKLENSFSQIKKQKKFFQDSGKIEGGLVLFFSEQDHSKILNVPDLLRILQKKIDERKISS